MVVALNDPQIWTIIGVFAATLIGGVTLLTQVFLRSMASLRGELTAQIPALNAGLNTRIDALHTEMVVRFEQVDRRFEQVEHRLDRLETRVDGLDKDVQAIARRVFPESPSH